MTFCDRSAEQRTCTMCGGALLLRHPDRRVLTSELALERGREAVSDEKPCWRCTRQPGLIWNVVAERYDPCPACNDRGTPLTGPYYDEDGITIYHGDCREITAWLKADVLVTDPPYGMDLRSARGGAFGASTIIGDSDTQARDEAIELWNPIKPALVFGRWSIARPLGTRTVLTWEKGEHVGMGDLRLPWKPNTEEICVLGNWIDREVPRRGSVLRHHAIAGLVGRADQGTRRHPTEKPLALMTDLISVCPPGWVADPFMGSGTTLVAAKQLGRKAIGVELSERYCEIAAKRLSQGVLDLFGGAA